MRVTDLEVIVGNKPAHLERQYDAPNLWGSINAIANIFESKYMGSKEESVRSLLDSTYKELEINSEFDTDTIKLNVESLKGYFDKRYWQSQRPNIHEHT